jgi:hypothetical protein
MHRPRISPFTDTIVRFGHGVVLVLPEYHLQAAPTAPRYQSSGSTAAMIGIWLLPSNISGST